jgi:hypothetical protein
MSKRFRKEVLLWSVAMCVAFGYNTLMANTLTSFMPSYVQLTDASVEAQVFFEAEKLYSVNFEDQSPRSASQATHESFMKTWTNKISISSERISRKLRGFDLFGEISIRVNLNSFSFENSYKNNILKGQKFNRKLLYNTTPNQNYYLNSFLLFS